jgi:hypothetical protein
VRGTGSEVALAMLSESFGLTGKSYDNDAIIREFEKDPSDPKDIKDWNGVGEPDRFDEFSYPDPKHEGSGDAAEDARVGNASLVHGIRRLRSVPHFICNTNVSSPGYMRTRNRTPILSSQVPSGDRHEAATGAAR